MCGPVLELQGEMRGAAGSAAIWEVEHNDTRGTDQVPVRQGSVRKTLIYSRTDQPVCPPPKANTHRKHHRLCVVAAGGLKHMLDLATSSSGQFKLESWRSFNNTAVSQRKDKLEITIKPMLVFECEHMHSCLDRICKTMHPTQLCLHQNSKGREMDRSIKQDVTSKKSND